MKWKKFTIRLTENTSNFGELSPADDGAHLSILDRVVVIVLGGRRRRVGGVCRGADCCGGGGGGRGRQADGTHIVAEVDGPLQLEQRQVVDEAGVQVARMLDYPRDSAQLLEWRWKVGSATQSAKTRYPVCVQIAASTNCNCFLLGNLHQLNLLNWKFNDFEIV